jgi:polysaccharide pyruvyl transferase WcaK-like protein
MSDADATRMFYLRLRHLFCCIAQIRGIPLVFAALGLGPLTTERGLALAGRILNMAEMVEVRDNNSYELCKKLNVSSRVFRGFDPAVLIGRQISKGIVRDSSSGDNLPTIGISLSGSPGTGLWQETGGDSKIDRVADALRRLTAVRRVRAAIIEMCACEHFSDRELGEKLMARLKGICEVTLIPYCPEPAEMMRRLSGLRCIVAERLHAAIYAYALEIPFAVIADHLKCEAFTMDVGLPESCVLRKDTPVENILRTLEWLLCANPGYRPTLAVEDACEMAASGQQAVIGALKASLVRAGQK